MKTNHAAARHTVPQHLANSGRSLALRPNAIQGRTNPITSEVLSNIQAALRQAFNVRAPAIAQPGTEGFKAWLEGRQAFGSGVGGGKTHLLNAKAIIKAERAARKVARKAHKAAGRAKAEERAAWTRRQAKLDEHYRAQKQARLDAFKAAGGVIYEAARITFTHTTKEITGNGELHTIDLQPTARVELLPESPRRFPPNFDIAGNRIARKAARQAYKAAGKAKADARAEAARIRTEQMDELLAMGRPEPDWDVGPGLRITPETLAQLHAIVSDAFKQCPVGSVPLSGWLGDRATEIKRG